MNVTTVPETVPFDHYDDEWHPMHAICECNEDIGLCGAELEGDILDLDDFPLDEWCVVCLELSELPCRRCGK